jgi:hypothetical protein
VRCARCGVSVSGAGGFGVGGAVPECDGGCGWDAGVAGCVGCGGGSRAKGECGPGAWGAGELAFQIAHPPQNQAVCVV